MILISKATLSSPNTTIRDGALTAARLLLRSSSHRTFVLSVIGDTVTHELATLKGAHDSGDHTRAITLEYERQLWEVAVVDVLWDTAADGRGGDVIAVRN